MLRALAYVFVVVVVFRVGLVWFAVVVALLLIIVFRLGGLGGMT